jgi:hypothetical protein
MSGNGIRLSDSMALDRTRAKRHPTVSADPDSHGGMAPVQCH